MGAVFSWYDIENRKIPELESFPLVFERLRNDLYEEPSVISALVCGSVLRGDHTRRSDIDCVVIYDTEREIQAMYKMHMLGYFAQSLHIPINFIPCDNALAKSRMNFLGPSFLKHLIFSVEAGGLIKGNLASLIGQSVPTHYDIESYFRSKMYNMQEALAAINTFGEERRLLTLKKALEAPMHAARKILDYKGWCEADDKKGVMANYCKIMPRSFVDSFKSLLQTDDLYSSELEKQLKNPNAHHYLSLLDFLESEIFHVIEFLRLNMSIFK